MPDYTLTLLIDNAVLRLRPPHTLCIAKKVNGDFTAVFAAGSIQPKAMGEQPLLGSNDFRWEDRYRLGAVKGYNHGMLVRSYAQDIDINFGDTTTWNDGFYKFNTATSAPADDFTNATGAGSSQDSFLVKSFPGNLHTVVQMQVHGEWWPIYVDPMERGGTHNTQLTLSNEYFLCWDRQVTANAMIDSSKLRDMYTFSFDGGAKTKTIRFGYAKPEKPEMREMPKFRNV